EDQVLLDADRIVAPAVEAFRVQPAEVAHARQRDVHKPIDEFVHARLAQRYLAADRLAVAHLEGCDRLARLCDHCLLARDEAEGGGGGLNLLPIGHALADPHVDHNFLNHRHFEAVLVVELLRKLLAHFGLKCRLEPRYHALGGSLGLRSRLLAAFALWRRLGFGTFALAALVGGLSLLALIALLGARGLLPLRRLAFGFFLFLSHRSRLPSAWRSAPSCGRDPRRRI